MPLISAGSLASHLLFTVECTLPDSPPIEMLELGFGLGSGLGSELGSELGLGLWLGSKLGLELGLGYGY